MSAGRAPWYLVLPAQGCERAGLLEGEAGRSSLHLLGPKFGPVASQAPVEGSFLSRAMTMVKGAPSYLPVTPAGRGWTLFPSAAGRVAWGQG